MRLSLVAAAYAAAMSTAVPAHAGGEGQVRADRSRSPRSSPGVMNRVAEIQRRLNLATESREARAAFGFVAVFAEERLPPIS